MNKKNNFLNNYYMGKKGSMMNFFSTKKKSTEVNSNKTNTSTRNETSGSTNTGIMGGLSNFGFGAGVGAGVSCDASDDSFFCQLTKLTSIISQFIFLFSVLFMIYIAFRFFIMPMMSGSNKRR